MAVVVGRAEHEVPVAVDDLAGHLGQLRGVRRGDLGPSVGHERADPTAPQNSSGRLSAVLANVGDMARFYSLCLDTANPGSDNATFWAAVSGGRVAPAEGGPADVEGRAEHENLYIVPVPEPKTVKNRVHLDVYARSIDDLVALGARVELPAEESGFRWTVMRDPEGNELCVGQEGEH
jgi:Glyoxalase-like domain